MVRQVCVLLQAFVRKYVAAMRVMLVEIQSFCLSFPKVKEATLLYGLVKSVEGSAR
jgi:hypothetical protein